MSKKVAAPVGPAHIKDLVPDPENRRQHNPRNLGLVVDALHQVGAARSIVIDEDNVILAGNGVTEAAAEAGITRVRVIEADGQELIAVRRVGLSPEQKRALAMYDNRAAELAEWNVEQLQADASAGLDLKPWFSDQELAKLNVAPAADGDGAESQLGGLEYRIIVECRDEGQQVDLLRRFEEEGLSCRALIS
jgi:hypothetical protein